MSWNHDVLSNIDVADDLKIAPYHPDRQTTGTPTWIWAVVVENRLFVRAYSGMASRWYQAALSQRAGRVFAAGQVFGVTFSPETDAGMMQKIDAAYRRKYAQNRYVSAMISARAAAATVEILLR